MTGSDHRSDLARLEEAVRRGDTSPYAAGRELLERVSADVPADAVVDRLNELRGHASDGVGVSIVEQAISDAYPEHPTPS